MWRRTVGTGRRAVLPTRYRIPALQSSLMSQPQPARHSLSPEPMRAAAIGLPGGPEATCLRDRPGHKTAPCCQRRPKSDVQESTAQCRIQRNHVPECAQAATRVSASRTPMAAQQYRKQRALQPLSPPPQPLKPPRPQPPPSVTASHLKANRHQPHSVTCPAVIQCGRPGQHTALVGTLIGT